MTHSTTDDVDKRIIKLSTTNDADKRIISQTQYNE
jgi:hypothetical protein